MAPLLICASSADTQTLKGRTGSVSVDSLGPGAHKVLFEPCECLRRVWALILNVISPLSCWGFSFPLGHGVSFFGGIQHSPVDGCSAACCILGVLTEDEHRSFYSILFVRTKHQRRIIEVDQPCLSDCGPLLHTYTVWQLKETSSCRLKGFRFSLPEWLSLTPSKSLNSLAQSMER